MVTTSDSGFTAERDISAYNKAAFPTKAMALRFNKETKKVPVISFRQRVRGWDGHRSKEKIVTGVRYIESEDLLYVCSSCCANCSYYCY